MDEYYVSRDYLGFSDFFNVLGCVSNVSNVFVPCYQCLKLMFCLHGTNFIRWIFHCYVRDVIVLQDVFFYGLVVWIVEKHHIFNVCDDQEFVFLKPIKTLI
jgi:hypothetical protein